MFVSQFLVSRWLGVVHCHVDGWQLVGLRLSQLPAAAPASPAHHEMEARIEGGTENSLVLEPGQTGTYLLTPAFSLAPT